MSPSGGGVMTSSPYVQPWSGTGTPEGGWDQPAPNPTAAVTPYDPLATATVKGYAAPVVQKFADFPLKPMPEIKDEKNEIKYVGAITPQPSATGGAYGMPSSTWGGPVYKSTAGKYYWDKAGKYPVPAEALALGGFK